MYTFVILPSSFDHVVLVSTKNIITLIHKNLHYPRIYSSRFLQSVMGSVQESAYQLLNNTVNAISPQKVYLNDSFLYYLNVDGRIMRVPVDSTSVQAPSLCVDWWCCGDYWYPPPHSPILDFYIREDWIYYTVLADWGQDLNPIMQTVILKTFANCTGESEYAYSGASEQMYDEGEAFGVVQVKN